MTVQAYHRGHPMYCVWYYSDTGEDVGNNPNRQCGHCEKPNRSDGHDACLGELPGVKNACCGHGRIKEAYIQFLSGCRVSGTHAITIMEAMKNGCMLCKKT